MLLESGKRKCSKRIYFFLDVVNLAHLGEHGITQTSLHFLAFFWLNFLSLELFCLIFWYFYWQSQITFPETMADKSPKTCTRCNGQLDDGDICCENCGLKVETKKPCINCGKLLKPTAKFCGKCGTATTPPAVRTCPKCGQEIEEDDAFCDECGTCVKPLQQGKGQSTLTFYCHHVMWHVEKKPKRVPVPETLDFKQIASITCPVNTDHIL